MKKHSVSWNLPKLSQLWQCNWGFRQSTNTEPPTDKRICEQYNKFQQSGCLCTAKWAGWLRPVAETVEYVWETFVRSPQKSTHYASWELWLPQSSVWHILRKGIHAKGYQLQLLQALNPQDRNVHFQFYADFQQRLEEDGFAEKLVFSDEATFRVYGKVNFVQNLRCTVKIASVLANSETRNTFSPPVLTMLCHNCPLVLKPASMPWHLLPKQTWRDSLAIDMLLSALSVFIVSC
jgi:hypothetical protein